ncbi:MAG: hypothetical protein V4733_11395 [Verrucomicrobiota bacterium]
MEKDQAKNAASAFGAGAGGTDAERERVRLPAKIGQQAVELDWLTPKLLSRVFTKMIAFTIT